MEKLKITGISSTLGHVIFIVGTVVIFFILLFKGLLKPIKLWPEPETYQGGIYDLMENFTTVFLAYG